MVPGDEAQRADRRPGRIADRLPRGGGVPLVVSQRRRGLVLQAQGLRGEPEVVLPHRSDALGEHGRGDPRQLVVEGLVADLVRQDQVRLQGGDRLQVRLGDGADRLDVRGALGEVAEEVRGHGGGHGADRRHAQGEHRVELPGVQDDDALGPLAGSRSPPSRARRSAGRRRRGVAAAPDCEPVSSVPAARGERQCDRNGEAGRLQDVPSHRSPSRGCRTSVCGGIWSAPRPCARLRLEAR